MREILPDIDNYIRLANTKFYFEDAELEYDYEGRRKFEGYRIYDYLNKSKAEEVLNTLEKFGLEGIVCKMNQGGKHETER